MVENEFARKTLQDSMRRNFFFATLMTSAAHWFFTQGQQAIENGLYVPGVSSLLNGVEASLRVTITQISEEYDGELELPRHEILSNVLLRKARDAGMPVSHLAFPGEGNFLSVIDQKSPRAEIVQLRHNICHGNILEFAPYFEGRTRYFTPECLRPTAALLLDRSYRWCQGLAQFRNDRGRRPRGEPIPDIPENPLAEHLPS